MEIQSRNLNADTREGLGIKEAISYLNMLVQNCFDQLQEVYTWFIDYRQAFDVCV